MTKLAHNNRVHRQGDTTRIRCPHCHGSGVKEKHTLKQISVVTCWACQGNGYLGEKPRASL